MNAYLWPIALLMLAFCHPASAQVYQYRDKAGQLHFTDDYYAVPADQRPAPAGDAPRLIQPEPGQEIPAAADSPAPADAPPASPAVTTAAPAVGQAGGGSPGGEGQDTRTPPDKRVAIAGAAEGGERAGKGAETLDARNQELKKTFQDLMTEKDRLEAQRSKVQNRQQAREMEAEIAAFNQKVEEYEQRRSALNDEINAYNEAMLKAEKEKKAGSP
jgi:hypothetical protein